MTVIDCKYCKGFEKIVKEIMNNKVEEIIFALSKVQIISLDSDMHYQKIEISSKVQSYL